MNTTGESPYARPVKDPDKTIKLLVPEITDLLCMNIWSVITGIRQIRIIIAFSDYRRLTNLLDFEYKCIFLTNYKWIREFGMRETANLIAEHPHLRMLVYLQPQEIRKAVTLFHLGVQGFFSNAVTRNELQQGLIKLARMEIFYSHDIIRRLLSSDSDEDADTRKPVQMTQLEQRLFSLILKGHSNPEIVMRLSMTLQAVDRARIRLNTILGFRDREHLARPFYNDAGLKAYHVKLPHEQVQTMQNNTVNLR